MDAALLIDGPLELSDGTAIENISKDVALGSLDEYGCLAERISIFWTSPEALTTKQSPLNCDARSVVTGRFGAVDQADWWQYGRLLAGEDVRSGLDRYTVPSP